MVSLQFDHNIDRIIEKLLRVNLFLQKDEKFLVVTDYPSNLDLKLREVNLLEKVFKKNFLTKKIYTIAKEKFTSTKTDLFAYPCPWVHYPKLDLAVRNEFITYDVIYVITAFSLSNELLRLPQEYEHLRVATSPFCDETTFMPYGALDIDDSKMENKVRLVYDKLKAGKSCHLYTHLGTDLQIDLEKTEIIYETGMVDSPGKVSNLPSGEVSIKKANVNGTYFVPKGWIEGLKGNLTLHIKNGHVVDIAESSEISTWLDSIYSLRKKKHQIDHISLGMNENATNPFSLVELVKMRGVANLFIQLITKQGHPLKTSLFSGHFPAPNIYLEIDGEHIFKNGRLIV